MSKGKKTQNQVTTTTPWGPTQPHLEKAMTEGGKLYEQGMMSPYVPPSQASMDQIGALENIGRQGSAVARGALGAYGNIMDPYSGMNAVREQALRGALVPTASMFENSGMLNTDLAAKGVAEQAAKAIAPIEYDAYNQAQDRSLRGMAMAPMMTGMERYNADILGEAGKMKEAYDAQRLGQPAANLQQYAALAQGTGGMGGTQTGTGEAGAKGGTASTIGGIMQTVGPLIAAFAMSDERTKTDIKKVGKTDGGTTVYSYKYKHMPQGPTLLGVMAQELEKKTPSAVKEFGGIKHVDYSKVT